MAEGAHGAPADTGIVGSDHALTQTVGRRTFLKVLGSSAPAAAAAACAPVPPEQLIPYVVPPEDIVPGVATWYATVCGECPAGCGMLVRTREGRAVKVEGNPEHPLNRGSLCVRGQASLQGLYNPDRFGGPLRRRETNAAAGQSVLEPIDRLDARQVFAEQLREARPGRVAVVTPLLSGALDRLVERWAEAVGARRIRYEPFAHEALRAAGLAAFGRRTIPHYDFARPDLIVSFGADFLETWLSPVEYGRAFAEGRRRGGNRRTRLVQLEPRLSLSGAQADEWLAIEPGTEGLIAAAMVHVIVSERRALLPETDAGAADRIFELVRNHAPEAVAARTGATAETIRTLARRFADPAAGGGRTLAVGGGVSSSGAGATAALTVIHLLNHVAGNTDVTVTFDAEDGADGDASASSPTGWNGAGSLREMLELAAAMEAGEIDLLLLHDVNPVYAMPGGARFAAAVQRVPFVVSTAACADETAGLADLVLPVHTPLEAWGDCEPRRGMRGLQQPAMRPLHDTRHLGDVLLDSARALGGEAAAALPPEGDFLDLLKAEWREEQARQQAATAAGETPDADFESFWDAARRRGGAWRAVVPAAVTLNPALPDVPLDLVPEGARSARWRWSSIRRSICTTAGAPTAPGCRKCPTRCCRPPGAAGSRRRRKPPARLARRRASSFLSSLTTARPTLPCCSTHGCGRAWWQCPLGQGHTHYGRYANGRGINAAALLDPAPEAGRRRSALARDARRRHAARRAAAAAPPADQLRPERPGDRPVCHARGARRRTAEGGRAAVQPVSGPRASGAPLGHGHRPGYVHRLQRLCRRLLRREQRAVLGADGMLRGRTMSWIRIERFVEEDDAGAGNRFLPMLCQHCDHAPCESVCPTYATYHTDEGLNAQIYNRCVGTRYCANNCPYKVRRFNWSQPEVAAPLDLQLNPDVTTRSMGVMEKCTFCVQRINEGQDRARDEQRPPRDGEITPACAQTCPAQAIVFGDLNDPGSRVSRAAADPRAYRVLETLNTRPAVTYLKQVRDA